MEIHVACKIVAPGPQRLQRRRQARFELDKASNGRGSSFANRNPNAVGRGLRERALDVLNAHDNAIAAFPLLTDLDETGHQHTCSGRLQDRMHDARRLQGRRCKPCRDRHHPKSKRETNRSMARQNRHDGARDHRR